MKTQDKANKKEYSLGKIEYRFDPEERKEFSRSKNEVFRVIWISMASYDPYQSCFPILYNLVWHP